MNKKSILTHDFQVVLPTMWPWFWCVGQKVYFQWKYWNWKGIGCERNMLHGASSNYPQPAGKRNLNRHNFEGECWILFYSRTTAHASWSGIFRHTIFSLGLLSLVFDIGLSVMGRLRYLESRVSVPVSTLWLLLSCCTCLSVESRSNRTLGW